VQPKQNGHNGQPQLDVLSMLPPDRQAAIRMEAFGCEARKIFREHQQSSLADVVRLLTEHAHWNELQQLALWFVAPVPDASSASVDTGASPADSGTNAKSNSKRQPPVLHPIRPKSTYGPRSLNGTHVQTVLKVIRENPGLRSEEIQRKSRLAPGAVRKVLQKLRREKTVKTKGEKRATTYSA
jgi:hypothetical protein